MTLRKPITGEAAMEIEIWYGQSGESPGKPYSVRRWRERRIVKVPGELLRETEERMSISTDAGDTTDIS